MARWYSARDDRTATLASCYRTSLAVADSLGARTVSFPAVSAGVYGWPMQSAADIAVETVRGTASDVDEVVFVLFGDEAYSAFERAVG